MNLALVHDERFLFRSTSFLVRLTDELYEASTLRLP